MRAGSESADQALISDEHAGSETVNDLFVGHQFPFKSLIQFVFLIQLIEMSPRFSNRMIEFGIARVSCSAFNDLVEELRARPNREVEDRDRNGDARRQPAAHRYVMISMPDDDVGCTAMRRLAGQR